MTDATEAALAAVFFDMDGLLVTSEDVWFVAEHDIMRELGGPWTDEHRVALVGSALDVCAAYMLDVAGRADVDPAWVGERLMDRVLTLLRDEPLSFMPGAQELLTEVTAAGVPAVLVSSSQRVMVDAVLAKVGVDSFVTTISGDDVEHIKPAPDPYRRAAAYVGAPASRCVALEDSTTGARAAHTAGCVTVGVPSLAPIDPTVVDVTLGSLAEIDLAGLRDLVTRRAR